MPRTPRVKSRSGIYHVMYRGTNRQEIFHDKDDCERFLETLERYKRESGFGLFSWCLMGNNVHLLVKEGNEELSLTMKRIGVSFASFYNLKYNTTGHLFQDRYRSEHIESERSLLAVVRYIHQNPVKAGLVRKPDEWHWSSCGEYYNYEYKQHHLLLDGDFVMSLFSGNRNMFIEFTEMANEDSYLENTKSTRLTDDELRVEINKLINNYEIAQLKTLSKSQRDIIVGRMKEINGVSQRQLSRILGIPLTLVNRAKVQ